jgi:signal peptidase I
MYSNISELPTEVKNALDEDDCKIFLEKFNEKNPQTEEEYRDAMRYAWECCKNLPSSFSFDIIASVEDVDSDGELITIKSLSDQMDKFIEQGGVVQSEHGDYRTAHIWGWDEYTDPDTGYPGVLVHGNVFGGRGENSEYAKARQDFLNGKNNLSIAGDASIEGYECDKGRCFVRRNLTQLMEISLVDSPANPYAKMLWYNDKAIVKGNTNLKVKNVGIHKSYNECDLEMLRKKLSDFDTKITSKGLIVKDKVSVGISAESVEIVKSKIKTLGQLVEVSSDSVVIDTNKRILEREFKKSFDNKECDTDGILTKNVGKGRFTELFNRSLIRPNKDGIWAFDGSILKNRDEDWDDNGNYIGPKNTIYVWDANGNEILCFAPVDEHDTSDGWSISNVGSERYWKSDSWGSHWDSIDEVVDAIRRHKRNVTIKRGVYWDDANYLEDI